MAFGGLTGVSTNRTTRVGAGHDHRMELVQGGADLQYAKGLPPQSVEFPEFLTLTKTQMYTFSHYVFDWSL